SSTRASGPRPDIRAYSSDETEALGIALGVRKANEEGLRFSEMAVLTRTNSQHAMIRDAMARLGIAARAIGSEALGEDTPGAPAAPTKSAEDAVTICSFHRAKGLQWRSVWVAGLEQGLVPIAYATTKEALDEERRLLYVALTRAEHQLHCSWATSRRTATGAVLQREPSMWLAPLSAHCAVASSPITKCPPAGSPTAGSPITRNGGAAGNMVDLVNAARRRLARTRSPLAHPPTDDPVGDAVASSLRDWRRRMARASGVPAYVILHDSTIELLASRRPMTSSELLSLPGMGPVKVARFGPAVCEVIRGSLEGAALQEGA
ncbi:MAG TPA: 3'-5' exonuclease, partial [Acidimicrobiales bacterium]|nr:3'-5' exonuclease [Acidimicrobiales bacterium]